MKKVMVFMGAMLALTLLCTIALAAVGPAPNSGDGVSDGSGIDNRVQIGDPAIISPGPAPNSGDGVSDGSGF